jgi:L-alanine-DL-glutamate epimerase-like enolase superfamily enzyme
MKKPVVMAGVKIARAQRVCSHRSDNGIVGWARPPTMTGETVESMMAAIGDLAPAREGRPADDIGAALAAMAARMYANHGAKAAIEIALHDLVGRATNQPAYALLGGKQRSRMAVHGVIGTGTLASDLREAERKNADGYLAFKIKALHRRAALTANAPAVCARCSGVKR